MKGRVLVLRYLLHLAVKLGSGGLINTAGIREVTLTHGFQNTQHAGCVHVGRELGRVERYLYMALCGEIIYFRGLYFLHYLQEAHRIAKVRVMQMEMGMPLQVGDTFPEINRRTADGAVYVISFLQQELGEERAVLTGDACD